MNGRSPLRVAAKPRSFTHRFPLSIVKIGSITNPCSEIVLIKKHECPGVISSNNSPLIIHALALTGTVSIYSTQNWAATKLALTGCIYL